MPDPEHLGGDRWKVRIYTGRGHDGRSHRRTRNFRAPNLRAARKTAARIETELRKAVDEDKARADTIAGLAEQWMQLKRDRRRSPSTLANYQRIADRIVERFGHLKVTELTPRHVDRWYAELDAGGMTPATVQHHHAVLRGMLSQAEKWEMVGRVATKAASVPDVDKTQIAIPRSEAVGLVVDAATGHFRVALEVIVATGCRRGEVVGLQWADLDGSILTVRRSLLDVKGHARSAKSTKGRRERQIPLDPGTVAVLEAHRLAVRAMHPGTPWMFPDRRKALDGSVPQAPSWLSGRWARHRKELGVAARLHDLRHWHLSVLMAAGISPAEVQERGGHAQLSTTLNVYGHVVPGRASAAPGVIVGELARGNIVDT